MLSFDFDKEWIVCDVCQQIFPNSLITVRKLLHIGLIWWWMKYYLILVCWLEKASNLRVSSWSIDLLPLFSQKMNNNNNNKKKPVSALNKRTGALVIHQPQVTDLSLPSGESNELRQFRVVHELLSSSWLEGMELRRWCCFLSAAHSCELSTQRPQTRRELLGTLLHGKPRWMDYRRTEQKPSSPSYFIQEKKNNSRPRLPLNRKRAGMLRAATVSETRARLMISI